MRHHGVKPFIHLLSTAPQPLWTQKPGSATPLPATVVPWCMSGFATSKHRRAFDGITPEGRERERREREEREKRERKRKPCLNPSFGLIPTPKCRRRFPPIGPALFGADVRRRSAMILGAALSVPIGAEYSAPIGPAYSAPNVWRRSAMIFGAVRCRIISADQRQTFGTELRRSALRIRRRCSAPIGNDSRRRSAPITRRRSAPTIGAERRRSALKVQRRMFGAESAMFGAECRRRSAPNDRRRSQRTSALPTARLHEPACSPGPPACAA